jgi:hypothetical protein
VILETFKYDWSLISSVGGEGSNSSSELWDGSSLPYFIRGVCKKKHFLK